MIPLNTRQCIQSTLPSLSLSFSFKPQPSLSLTEYLVNMIQSACIVFFVNVLVTLSEIVPVRMSIIKDGIETIGDDSDVTTQLVTIVHRLPDSSGSSSGNRLSLLNSRYNKRPRKKNLEPDQLAEILGDFYDPNWMSVDRPAELSQDNKGVTYSVRPDAWPYQELIKALLILNLTHELGEYLMPTQVAAVERWFLKRASCPVKYAWEDVGPMFWPRWIKRGECAHVRGTCSWPPGMHCVETNRANLQVLRWQCRLPKSKGRRRIMNKRRVWKQRLEPDQSLHLRCHWIRVSYPITSACRCSC